MGYCKFYDMLRQLRKQRNLTQSELGAHIGISKAVISKYENGLGYPTFDLLMRFAKYFGVSTDYLLGMESKQTIDVSDLTKEQIDSLYGTITEYRKK